MAGVAKYLNGYLSNSVIEATFIRMGKDNRNFHEPPIGKPNAQAELRGLTFSRRAAVSSSLWLGSINEFYELHCSHHLQRKGYCRRL